MALGHKRTVGEVTTESHACSELESSGTMQLLDRLGHSLAELPGLGSDTDDSSNKARASDHLPSVGGYRAHPMQPIVPGLMANMTSLRRIRALLDGDSGTGQEEDRSQGGASKTGARQKPLDAPSIFKGVRTLLEQNTGDDAGSEMVARECLQVLKKAVAWLACGDGEGAVAGVRPPHAETDLAKLQGPEHGSHVARACIAPAVPSVLDCFARRGLRKPAREVLVECIQCRALLPDVTAIVVDQLVNYGMEHDNRAVRLWSTLSSPQILVRCVGLGTREYNTMLDGLVGRAGDIDDGVVDGALQALQHTHGADPTRFEAARKSLGPVQQRLLRHHWKRINSSRGRHVGEERAEPGEQRVPAGVVAGCAEAQRGARGQEDLHRAVNDAGDVIGSPRRGAAIPQSETPSREIPSEAGAYCGGTPRRVESHGRRPPTSDTHLLKRSGSSKDADKLLDLAQSKQMRSQYAPTIEDSSEGVYHTLRVAQPEANGVLTPFSGKVESGVCDPQEVDSEARGHRNSDGNLCLVSPDSDTSGKVSLTGPSESSVPSASGAGIDSATAPIPSMKPVRRPQRQDDSNGAVNPVGLMRILLGVAASRQDQETKSTEHRGYYERGQSGPAQVETAADPSRRRILAMEDARRQVHSLDEGAFCSDDPRIEELFTTSLEITEDPDINVALSAFRILHGLVGRVGWRRQTASLHELFGRLVAKLGDHKVAVRNSAMIVLSTLVRKVGLEVATPHLVKSGMHAVHWRPREGALRLVIGGLLLSTTSSICDLSRGSSAQGAGGAENVSGSRAEEQEFKRLPPRSSRNEDRDGRGGCSIPANSSRALVGERSSHVSAEMQEEQGVSLPPDRQWLAGEVGRLLTDKRHEVRHAAVETLATAAQAWRDKGTDILTALEQKRLLRSSKLRRKLAARLQGPASTLPRFGPDDVIEFNTNGAGQDEKDAPGDDGRDLEDSAKVQDLSSVENDSSRRWKAGDESAEHPCCATQVSEMVDNDGPTTTDGFRLPRAVDQSSSATISTSNDGMLVRTRPSRPVSASDACGDASLCLNQNISGTESSPGVTAAVRRYSSSGSLESSSVGGIPSGKVFGDDAGGTEDGIANARPCRDPGAGRSPVRCWQVDALGDSVDLTESKGGNRPAEGSRDEGDRGDGSTPVSGDGTPPKEGGRGGQAEGSHGTLSAPRGTVPVAGQPRRVSSLVVGKHACDAPFPASDRYVPSWASGSGAVACLTDGLQKSPRLQNGGHDRPPSTPSAGTRRRRPPHQVFDGTELASESFEVKELAQTVREEEYELRVDCRNPRLVPEPNAGDVGAGSIGTTGRGVSPIPDPRLLSTLKSGGSRISRANRRAVSAAAVRDCSSSHSGGVGGTAGATSPASSFPGAGILRPRQGMQAEPTTPVPVGSYDSMGRRIQMQTSVQQPLPLVHSGVAGSNRGRIEACHQGLDATPRCREGRRFERGGSSVESRATVCAPSPRSALKRDAFDYLTAEDIRPSPHPSQELQRAITSLARDDWPEIFHSLNSVRRLAIHHAELLSSQPHLHALVRDVLAQVENLRSQVAKNALLTLADLWRGLGDSLDPEVTMLCPILVKKMADKVEFLAETARECAEEVVTNATESRALSAFLACGKHRSPMVRAKAALAVLLCIRRRCGTGLSHECSGGRSARQRESTTGTTRRGLGPRELDRLLAILPRFLQDGNQETRSHAKATVALLVEAGEVDEARLQREIPAHVLERLQRDLLNSSLSSGLGFNLTSSSPASASDSRRSPGAPKHSCSSSVPTWGSSGCRAGDEAGGAGVGKGAWVLDKESPRVQDRGRRESGSPRPSSAANSLVHSEKSARPILREWKRGSQAKGLSGKQSIDSRSSREGLLRRSRAEGRGGASSSGAKDTGHSITDSKRPKASKGTDLIPGVLAKLDSSHWRERLAGLEEGVQLLEEHGNELHGAGKLSRLLDRIVELVADGNLRVNLLALEGVIRLASCLGTKLESVANTLLPAVCKTLASTNHQLVALGEETLDAICDALDPCLLVQPVATLAQCGNLRLKVPMLDLLRDLAPVIGRVKPQLLTKYVRPAASSLLGETRARIRDSVLSLLHAVDLALEASHRRGETGGRGSAKVPSRDVLVCAGSCSP